MFVLFFGGISLHLTTAIACHFLSIKIEWTTTTKELETNGFRVGLDKIFRDFKYMYMVIIPVIGGELSSIRQEIARTNPNRIRNDLSRHIYTIWMVHQGFHRDCPAC